MSIAALSEPPQRSLLRDYFYARLCLGIGDRDGEAAVSRETWETLRLLLTHLVETADKTTETTAHAADHPSPLPSTPEVSGKSA